MPVCWQCFREKNTEGACPFCGYDGAGQALEFPRALHPGSILNGRYIVGRVLGQGGFGITYLALDDRTKERIAIKEYFPAEFVARMTDARTVLVDSASRREDFEYGRVQFLEEAKTLAAVNGSSNIIRIYSYFEENGTAYFAMEYVEGLPLDEYIRKQGRCLGAQEAETLFLPLMTALEDVHKKGIVHRDISPDNILITEDGTAKLIDFGAARYSTGEKSKSLDVILKHGFAPYEQYMRRGRQGPWTDVYALAATFYYAVTGKVPPEAIERRDQDTMVRPDALGVRLGTGTEAVLMKALSVQAPERWQNIGEFRAALQAAAMAEAEERRKAEQERLAREAREREAREKAERLAREKQEKAERAAQKKAEREARKAAKTRTPAEPEQAAPRKKNPLPLILAAVFVLALVVFGVTKLTGKVSPAADEAPLGPGQAEFILVEEPLAETVIPDDLPAEETEYTELPDAQVGDIVLFGAYEQDNDKGNGKEAIEWLVLSKEEDQLLVLSRYALDCRPFHEQYEGITWEECALRSWLNGDFLNEAFGAEEQKLIPNTTVKAELNPKYNTNPGNNTEDRVFLLSIREANEYFDSNKARQCSPTSYAKEQGCYGNPDNDKCWWWLRSSGTYTGLFYSALVNHDGSINMAGAGVNNDVNGVRPVMWIDVSKITESGADADTPLSEPATVEENGLTFAVFDNHAEVTDSDKTLTVVEIPSEINGKPLTCITSRAFYDCISLERITIPGTVTDIGDFAFCNCRRLKSITLPEGVTGIGAWSFSSCSRLASITLPESVTSIGYRAFNGCEALTEIALPTSLMNIGDGVFCSCSALKSITLPEGVTCIGGYTFYNCSYLREITLPKDLTSIGSYTFYGCRTLTEITLPESLTSIGDNAFTGCSSLKSVTIPKGVTGIGNDAFFGCTMLRSITLPEDVSSIGNRAFCKCRTLKEITLPESLTSIGYSAFYGCEHLKSIYAPAGSYAAEFFKDDPRLVID